MAKNVMGDNGVCAGGMRPAPKSGNAQPSRSAGVFASVDAGFNFFETELRNRGKGKGSMLEL